MTLIQLRAFCSVVEQGSFRAAARALDIAQSTLTQAIQSLESELGVVLLNHSHQGISLTALGENVLIRASDHSRLRACDAGHAAVIRGTGRTYRAWRDIRTARGIPVARAQAFHCTVSARAGACIERLRQDAD